MVDEWVADLCAAGAGAHRVVDDVWPLMDNDWARAHGLSVTRDHDGLGPITTIGPSPRLSHTPASAGRPAPRPGSDVAPILASIGRVHDLDRLVRDGVVVTEGISAR
jgi:crotonobetainyl-CoA:carnitine CoA-transferase CaiB-like acyl-CoA transferase